MKYVLTKFRVYLLGDRTFIVLTDHASLCTAVNSPHLSQRMVMQRSFFAEYNFSFEYKPGQPNVVAEALSRRPDFDPTTVAVLTLSVSSSTLYEDIRKAYNPGMLRLMHYLLHPSGKILKTVVVSIPILHGLIHSSQRLTLIFSC